MSRKLKVLVMDDNGKSGATPENTLGTTDVELTRIIGAEGSTQTVLKDWNTLLEFLQDRKEIERPDLILMDIWFDADQTGPRLGSTEELDPRGLLYGGVLTAYFRGEQRLPLGFAIYSQDTSAVADLPYAQTFYGMLDAMAKQVTLPVSGGRQFQKKMNETPSAQMPGAVLSRALGRYREDLETCVGRSLAPDETSFHRAQASVSEFLKGEGTIPEDLTVRWRLPDGQWDEVLLSSLYADCRPKGVWNKGLLADKGVVDELANFSLQVCRILRGVKDDLDRWFKETGKGWGPDFQRKWSRASDGHWEKVVVFTILWAFNRRACNVNGSYQQQTATSITSCVLSELAASARDRTMRRALGHVIYQDSKRDYSAKEFIQLLDESKKWPVGIPVWLHEMTTRYLSSKYDDKNYWPKCLLTVD